MDVTTMHPGADAAADPVAVAVAAGASRDLLRDWPLLLFIAAIPVAVGSYLITGWALPLWFDEAFTGTIATQPSFARLIDWCLSEMSGPAFYIPMWLWVKLAGASDAALRIPALTLACATPLLIAWRGHPDRDVRLFWAALALLWLPMVPMATEARPYPLLVFLGTLEAIAFLELMRSPSLGRAWLWSTASALAILTHYYAATAVLFQAFFLVAIHRRAVLRYYPAAVPFLVAGTWAVFHLHFLMTFASGHIAAYQAAPPSALLAAPNFLFGVGLQGSAVCVMLAWTRPLWWNRIKTLTPETCLVWAGLAAFGLILVAGILRATLQPRYVTPAVPALLFGVACWASQMRSRQPMTVLIAFAALFVGMVASPIVAEPDERLIYRSEFQFETASQWLGERPVDRLNFLWSTPTGAQSPAPRLADVAGFFFRRDGHPVDVVVSRGGDDPNAALLAAAGDDPKAALLWLSDNDLPAGVTPAIERGDPRWQCRNFGSPRFLIYACHRKATA